MLLRFLQEREFQRVGGTKTLRADVRVVAATTGTCWSELTAAFPARPYYRLQVLEVRMPSLSEIREDIPLLAEHFLKRFRYIRIVSGISDEAVKHSWHITGPAIGRFSNGSPLHTLNSAWSRGGRVLLDAQFMCVLARLIVLRAAKDQLLERDALRLDNMKVLLFLDGTGRDHGFCTSGNYPDNASFADVGHLKAHGKRVAVWRLLGIHKWLACHPDDRDDFSGCDRFTVRKQFQQSADADCRDHSAARAES